MAVQIEDKRLKIQCDSYKNVQRAFANYKKSPKERISVGYLSSRLESLETYWREFKMLHQKIIQDIPMAETSSTAAGEKSPSYDFDYEVYDSFEELYYTYKGELKNALQRLHSDSEVKIDETTQNSCKQSMSSDVKLPRITIPTFSGNYTEWQSFHDLFLALIHKNSTLEDVQKLHYLKTNLKGDAEALLRQFAITGENYIEAWTVLKRRYNNKRYIANCIFKKFFGQKPLPYESANLLKQLLDTSVECINALKNLGLPTAQWDAIVNFIVVTKLDTETHKQWEESLSKETENLPSFEQLKSFLETKFRTLEMVEPTKRITKPVNTRSFHAAELGEASMQCSFCKEKHLIHNCKKFAKLSQDERHKFVRSKNLCYNCLVPNHTVFRCKHETSCKICGKRHHSLLHYEKQHLTKEQETTEKTTPIQKEEMETKLSAHMSQERPVQRILLATALVGVTSRAGEKHIVRALIDQGSEASFVTSRVVDLLGLKKKRINGVVSGVGEESRITVSHMVDLEITSCHNATFSVNIKAYVLKSLTCRLPVKEVKICNWPQLTSMELADPNFGTPSRVDILLGADVFCKIIDSGLIRGPGDLIAQYTNLGWILSGDMDTSVSSLQSHHITSLHVTNIDVETNDLLKKFWEIDAEHYTKKKMLTKEESKCEEIYENTTTRDKDGRFTVHLPLKQSVENTVKLCGDSKKLAVTRLESLERRFRKNKHLKDEYKKVIYEYLQLGHMQKVDDSERAIYLAHHPVIRESSDTTKVRVVFDASAKGTNGHSLNDCMMIGPTLQPDLRSIIIKWRFHKICVIADIVKMYRQIRIDEKHADLQRIVWRDNETDKIDTYQLKTVTFGTAAAPYLAVKTLSQLATEEAREYPETSIVIKTSFYMDDLMSGNDDIESTKRMCEEIRTVLKKGGFEMQKWSSNNEEIIKHLQDKENNGKDKIDIKLDKVIKILGLTWDRKDDMFKFTVNLPELCLPITKRVVLSDVARLFDPFGWLSPVVIIAKILIQKLWLCNSGWDDELPLELKEDWLRYRGELVDLQGIRLPRWFKTTLQNCNAVELHGFSDASADAYAAVVYLRVIEEDEVFVTMIASRTKVTPLKQMSIPKLELCAAALLAELITDVRELLTISKHSTYAWTDSMIVLSWLQSEPSRWRTFVANRVADILRNLDYNQWHHVKTSENPADIATRGVKARDLVDKTMWWIGPNWLSERQIEMGDILEVPPTELEQKGTYHNKFEEEPIWQRFSTMSRMKRVLSYNRRFICNEQNRGEPLTAKEMNIIELRCVRYYQNRAFYKDIECLKKEDRVSSKSSLLRLAPFLDENSLLRVGGRLKNSVGLSVDFKHPIIIPAKQHITTLIIREAHTKTYHGGVQQTMAYIRCKYWIINLKSAIRGYIRSCTVCIRDNAKIKQQLMGQLPAPRVNPARAFSNSGVDFAGPIQIRTSRGRGHQSTKGYICLFVCMSTKAFCIHLECVSDLTTPGFIAAFRRFVARRGHCSNLWSDNGTNFVGAARELKNMFEAGKSNMCREIRQLLANDGCTWHFIPPRSPNFGGLWEAGVKSAKRHLTRINGSIKLTYEEMSTLLTQIEACLNSRPLCQLDDTPETLNSLTPGHFLVGEPLIGVPEENYLQKNINLLTRWQFIQNRIQDFWKRWQADYLHTMQQRYKWQKAVPSPSVGDVVIIKEDDLPPCKWLLGRIVELHPGSDKLVRVVSVKYKGNFITKRPLSKLILLPTKPEL